MIGPPPSYSNCVPPGYVYNSFQAQKQPPPYGAPPGYNAQGSGSLESTGAQSPPMYSTADLPAMHAANSAQNLQHVNNDSLLSPRTLDEERRIASAPNLDSFRSTKPFTNLPPIQPDKDFSKAT